MKVLSLGSPILFLCSYRVNSQIGQLSSAGVAAVFTTQKQLELEAKHLQGSLVKYTKLYASTLSLVCSWHFLTLGLQVKPVDINGREFQSGLEGDWGRGELG